MAKSIFDILDDVTTETSVPSQGEGVIIAHTLPRDLFPTSEQFESEELLLDWAREWGFTHAILQRGIQKFLIEARATFKGCKKDDIWSTEYGQDNVDAMTWTHVKRPNQPKHDQAAIAAAGLQATIDTMQSMIAVGLGKTKIKEVLSEKYSGDEAVIDAIINQLDF